MTPFGPATGWWRRVGATLVDALVLIIPYFIVDVAGGRVAGSVLGLVIQAAYQTIMLSQRGQTLGNMAVGTRVVDARTGGPLSPAKALGRWGAGFLFGILGILILPPLLDIFWPLWDRQNQTLHDKMAGTLVLRTP
ncbi:MAG TPA: RDD family protein [Acidimicrobiales bacterium]|nr:RDD family protein [Acidimicrobiales bacterium]